MTRQEALDLFNDTQWFWSGNTENYRGMRKLPQLALKLFLERSDKQENFFYFNSDMLLIGDRDRLYGVWLYKSVRDILDKHPTCYCVDVTIPDKQTSNKEKNKQIEGHVAKVEITLDDEKLEKTAKEALKSVL